MTKEPNTKKTPTTQVPSAASESDASLVASVHVEDVRQTSSYGPHPEVAGLTLAGAGRLMEEGALTSAGLTRMYLDRIAALDMDGPTLKSVLELNPDALTIAESMDAERAEGTVRGPMHGVPVLLKDNIDTADSMHTTAGSLALMSSTPAQDATVVAKLREAGAVILGKTNLSEWANMRGFGSSSGWSARGGSTRHPHSLLRNPSGSSSGSAVAVAAGLAPIAIATETNGSIVCPASASGVVGMKPTVGLTSRAGVIPISHSMDSIGPMGKTVTDVAVALTIMSGVDPRDVATAASESVAGIDFVAALDVNALKGARLGVPTNFAFQGYSAKTDQLFAAVLKSLVSLGAEIVTAADIPTADEINESPGSWERMVYEFKRDMNAYLAERGDPGFSTLSDLIAFNIANSAEELCYFGQQIFEISDATSDDDAAEMQQLHDRLNRLSRDEGIDAVLAEHKLDALIAPSMAPASMTDLANGEQYLGSSSNLTAIAGYPIITVPAGLVHGLPVGLSFMGTAWSDARLLALAYAWEQATKMYRLPTFAEVDVVNDPDTPTMELPPVSASPVGTPVATPVS